MGFWRGLTKELAERITGKTVVEDPYRRKRGDIYHSGFSVEAAVSDTLANLTCSGFLLTIDGENERACLMRDVSQDFAQYVLTDMMSIGFETGDCLVVPTWDGDKFTNSLVGRGNFHILSIEHGQVRSVAFVVDEFKTGANHYRLVQVMSLEDNNGKDGCHYTLHKIKNDSPTNEKMSEWDEYNADWWVRDVDRLLLGRYKSPIRDKRNPNAVYGIPICHNASQPIEEIHYLIDQLHNEFELSEKAVVAPKAMFEKDQHGHLNLPRGRDRLFMATRGGSVDANAIQEWAPTIQVMPYIEALEVQKRQVEKLIGVDDGIISNPNMTNYANVDHVRKSMRNTQAFIDRARGVADQTIDDLIYSWDVLLNHYGLPTGTYTRDRDWSDEYIETYSDKRDALVAGYQIGATDALDFRLFALSEAPEVAQQRVAEIQAQRTAIVVGEE